MLSFESNFLIMSFATNTVQVFNSSSNPIIYALRSKGFKSSLDEIKNKMGRKFTKRPKGGVNATGTGEATWDASRF